MTSPELRVAAAGPRLRASGLGVLLPGTCYLGIVEGHVEDIGTCVKIAGVALLCCYNGIYYMDVWVKPGHGYDNDTHDQGFHRQGM